jgi:DNA-directed RNA polymerase specialized sigma24 family protein
MSRIEEKSTDEIAKELHLSRRTVESHQFMARREVRENLRRII